MINESRGHTEMPSSVPACLRQGGGQPPWVAVMRNTPAQACGAGSTRPAHIPRGPEPRWARARLSENPKRMCVCVHVCLRVHGQRTHGMRTGRAGHGSRQAGCHTHFMYTHAHAHTCTHTWLSGRRGAGRSDPPPTPETRLPGASAFLPRKTQN